MAATPSRKELIAQSALRLFAERGFDTTSTLRIAQAAHVSEPLIYKHFSTKDKLLECLIKTGYQRIAERLRGRLVEADPLALVHWVVELPFLMVQEEPLFWKMQAKLPDYALARQQHASFIRPLPSLLTNAFRNLNYPHPEREAQLLLVLVLVEGSWKQQALQVQEPLPPELLELLKGKYSYQAPDYVPTLGYAARRTNR